MPLATVFAGLLVEAEGADACRMPNKRWTAASFAEAGVSESAERMPASEKADGALPFSQVGSLRRRSVEGSSNQSAAAHAAREIL